MFGLHENKPMEKRDEKTPGFNSKNKTDRKIVTIVVLSLGIVLVLAIVFILIYIFYL
jgi:hypothetical protein